MRRIYAFWWQVGLIPNGQVKYIKLSLHVANEQWLGAGGASTVARTGAKLANSHKLSGELLPRLRQTQFRRHPPPLFLIGF